MANRKPDGLYRWCSARRDDAVVRFVPAVLREHLATVFRQADDLCIDLEGVPNPDDLEDVDDADVVSPDDEVLEITDDSRVEVSFPRCERDATLSLGEVLDLFAESGNAEFLELRECRLPTRTYLRLSAPDVRLEALLVASDEDDVRYPYLTPTASTKQSVNGHAIGLALVQGLTPFAVQVVVAGEYEKFLPPWDSDDVFIEVRHEKAVPRTIVESAISAYLFEIIEATGIIFRPTSRTGLWYPDAEDEAEHVALAQRLKECRVRPLTAGPGTTELLRLYMQAVATDDPELQVIGFVKVVEFTSSTATKLDGYGQIRLRLTDARALLPDSLFISDLIALVGSLEKYKQDAEAMKLTVVTACDAVMLARFAPSFLAELAAVTQASTKQARDDALRGFASCLSATRNRLLHAKVNYRPTGRECPEEQLAQLAKCARAAAVQAIRWYNTTDPAMRVS